MFPLHPITPHYIPLHTIIYIPIGSMYGIYANIGGILMVNVTIYSIHGSYALYTYIYIYILYPVISARDSHCLKVTFSSFPRSCWKFISMCAMDCYGARHCAVEKLGLWHPPWHPPYPAQDLVFFPANLWDSHGFNGEFT